MLNPAESSCSANLDWLREAVFPALCSAGSFPAAARYRDSDSPVPVVVTQCQALAVPYPVLGKQLRFPARA